LEHSIVSTKTFNNENSVSLCSNCQRIVYSHQFKKNQEHLVDSESWKWINNYYKIAEKNIRNYYFK